MKRRIPAIAALLALPATLLAVPAVAIPAVAAASDDSVVRTDTGLVRGIVGDETRTFRGIPYAAPPTGELRWRSPSPAAKWTGVRDATQYADPCTQGEHPVGVASTSEDCLYLDVTTPTRTAQNRPVVVWIHGGSFKHGATSIYQPEPLVTKGDVAVIEVQYRLGALGFLASPLLERSGTFGLEDQQAALRWVQRNAAAFGGNPRNVTVMGESAGAYSVCDNIASPTAAGLFQRAIMQSGPCTQDYSINYAAPRPREVAETYGRQLAESLGCATADCLRKVPADRLLAATDEAEFSPVLGGPVLPIHPATALLTGRVNKVPVLHGINHDEEHGRYGAQEAATGVPITTAQYEAEVRRIFGADADRVLEEYSEVQPAGLALSIVLTDSQWAFPAARSNRMLSLRMPTYTFEFAGKAPWYNGLPEPGWPVGSHHMSDLAYLFDLGLMQPLNADQQKLADEVIARWSAFARTGNPNAEGTQYWPRATPVDQTVQSLNPAGVTRTDFLAEHQIGFWRSLED